LKSHLTPITERRKQVVYEIIIATSDVVVTQPKRATGCVSAQKPVSSEICDLRNRWLHAVCACA